MGCDFRKLNLMKNFWDQKARENAMFYIATWRGYENRDLADYFLTKEQAYQYLSEARYEPGGNDRMLEIGCGNGRMTMGFAQLFQEVHAIDVSGEMIRQAKENLTSFKNVFLYETNGKDLGIFENEKFDFCFSFIVFQHIPSKSTIFNYVKEAGRVLKPGGFLHFQLDGRPDPDIETPPVVLSLKRFYRNVIRRPLLLAWSKIRGGPGGFESPAWLGVSVSSDEIRLVCEKNKLEVRTVTGEDSQYMWVTAIKRHGKPLR
jgi:ubiquinone/menaquinone biosynthesis C-methylase UbiE